MNAALARPLATAAAADPNPAWLAQILAARRAGHGCLPWRLGLEARDHAALLAWLGADGGAAPAEDLRQELLELRRDEWDELRELLLAGRRGAALAEVWLAAVVAAACLGGNHLWRDLGLASRQQLRELLLHNFPVLAQRNVADMRWKKFFYKQLCERDGGHLCRAPSCAQCPTYHDCFGAEL
ncbi:MAG TPA: nitrogen fixation protein NifQ [Pseudomonas sp.]|nr:nitrogen fixation protein NifQ [Pseudomonas sp.]